jgi:fatty-acyl-CoA synthase
VRDGHELSAEVLRAHLAQSVAKWWLPEEVVFVADLPHYSTGKVQKDVLRKQYGAAVFAKQA